MLPEILRRRIAELTETLDDRAMLRRLRDYASRIDTDFSALERVLLFVGYPRSGHSLVGALIGAHPEAIISHELNLLSLQQRGLPRERLLELIVARERHFAAINRRWEGFDYSIGGWGGEPARPRLMGDKKGSGTALGLERHPDALAALQERLGTPVFVLHVMRHPLDNVATIARRERSSIREAFAKFNRRVETVARIRGDWPSAQWFDVRYEDVVKDVKGTLGSMLTWLDLPPSGAYLEACAQAVFKSPHKSRQLIDWRPIESDVSALVEAHDFMAGYRSPSGTYGA
jgi:hypothetical protein